MKQAPKDPLILLSKRANVFYIEHARIMVKEGRIIYLVEHKNGIDRGFNIPDRNTSFLLLGKGTSITDGAVRMLAESGVQVGFCGNGGSPLLAAIDFVFLSPQSEYRPTAYMQSWMRLWLDDERRVGAAKRFLRIRAELTAKLWGASATLRATGLGPLSESAAQFINSVERPNSTSALLSREAEWAKALYARMAKAFRVDDFRREEGKRSRAGAGATTNSLLDHGNYIAYGYAAVALYALGISFALPLLHGSTRRGALVFDVADLVKDAVVMPLAFEYGSAGATDQAFRSALIDAMQEHEVVDVMIDALKSVMS
ncbi:CRISPR-associated endonuclease Cas1 [mine drainage metagenome]|uniref:CRISPR-associated endonuclease Cas1 n=1 Tax=mine drainage metagenome TaxID=410659 RepID=A0A1J5QXD1_9ZZZZ